MQHEVGSLSKKKKKTQTKKEGYHETAKPWGSLRGRSQGIFTLIFSLVFHVLHTLSTKVFLLWPENVYYYY